MFFWVTIGAVLLVFTGYCAWEAHSGARGRRKRGFWESDEFWEMRKMGLFSNRHKK